MVLKSCRFAPSDYGQYIPEPGSDCFLIPDPLLSHLIRRGAGIHSYPAFLTRDSEEGRFYHGYYRNYCRLPLYIFCGEHLLCARRVIGKAEHLAKGENPRFVVTSLSLTTLDARALYEDLYCARGDMENRIKEQQLALFADRTSSHEMRSNPLRLNNQCRDRFARVSKNRWKTPSPSIIQYQIRCISSNKIIPPTFTWWVHIL